VLLFIIGVISGIISGMGIGGGTVLIPALVLFAKSEQHVAQSVNLLFFIPTAITALCIHIKNKRIDYKMALPIIVFGLGGAYAGSKLAGNLPGETLRKIFGVFLLCMGMYEMLRKDARKKREENYGKL